MASRPFTQLKVSKKRAPTRAIEKEMWERGHDVVVGVDEVGRGAWAGPLSVGAAIVPRDTRVNGVRDSKLLSEREREALFDRLTEWCVAWAVGSASQEECDHLGMSAAQKLAARRAIDRLGVAPDVAVTDGRWDFVSPSVPHVELAVKADLRCLSVATASILAKVVRDREMRAHAEDYPNWSFDTNKGYPVPGAQGCTARLRPVVDSPPQLGVHGPLRPLDRHPPHPTRRSDLTLLTPERPAPSPPAAPHPRNPVCVGVRTHRPVRTPTQTEVWGGS